MLEQNFGSHLIIGNCVHFRVHYRMLLKSLQYPICIGLYLGQHKGASTQYGVVTPKGNFSSRGKG